ncbi:MAG: [FeFe] hydrogenase H-cluster radical SAM maturase HydE [Candidatus Omnitrophica bacterium]|nr:[FeFe] hydrogenase H-cluster radical SAM maturase HydE [Candidatus Omnitrophota bacterium]
MSSFRRSGLPEKIRSFRGEDMPAVREILSLPSAETGITEEADALRARFIGEGVLFRGIINFSNFCDGACSYCGLNRPEGGLERYRMSPEEILEAAGRVFRAGVRTIVLQSGQDGQDDCRSLAEVIREIKYRYDVAVTVSIGEKTEREYRVLRDAGADRYLLKIETSNRRIYEALHPGMSFDNRVRCLETLRALGFQTGSGIIVGLKGQTKESLAEDLVFLGKLALDMVAVGPFVPHGETALGLEPAGSRREALSAISVMRILSPLAHIPATTALGAESLEPRMRALAGGANVIMADFTPPRYARSYEIYPAPEIRGSRPEDFIEQVKEKLPEMGRYADMSRGDSLLPGRRDENVYNTGK